MVFGVCGNITKEKVRIVVSELIEWFKQHKVDFIIEKELFECLKFPQQINTSPLDELSENSDIVLSLGGDGTLLSTARSIGSSGVPLLGINLGRLGFLTEVVLDELYESLEDIINNNFTILERKVIEVSIKQQYEENTYYALNDLVIDRGGFSRVIKIKVWIDDEYLNTFLGDGAIIATPTGSTAYSLSAFGPILHPSVNCLIINPICPHSLGVRPVVIPDTSLIKLIPDSEEGVLNVSIDGQVNKQFKKGEKLEIFVRQADHRIKWIKHKNKTFYNLLRTKFNWGVDKRMY